MPHNSYGSFQTNDTTGKEVLTLAVTDSDNAPADSFWFCRLDNHSCDDLYHDNSCNPHIGLYRVI